MLGRDPFPASPISSKVTSEDQLLFLTEATVYNSANVGMRSRLVWWCESSFAPLYYSLLTTVIHFTNALVLRISLRNHKEQREVTVEEGTERVKRIEQSN